MSNVIFSRDFSLRERFFRTGKTEDWFRRISPTRGEPYCRLLKVLVGGLGQEEKACTSVVYGRNIAARMAAVPSVLREPDAVVRTCTRLAQTTM